MIERLLPARLHRALMPLAERARDRWWRWRGKPIEGVSVVITDRAGNILLVRHSYGHDVWSLPGGGLKSGEDPTKAAQREALEEVGIELDGVVAIGPLQETLRGLPHTLHLFSATCDAQPIPDQREIIEARFFARDALPERLGLRAKRRIAAWQAHQRATTGS